VRFTLHSSTNKGLLSTEQCQIKLTPYLTIAVLGGIRQGIIYIGYFQGGDRTLATVLYVPILTGACFSALAFTFSHLNAAILLFANKSRSKITKRAWIPIYNVAFVAFPLVWTGIIVVSPLTLVFQDVDKFPLCHSAFYPTHYRIHTVAGRQDRYSRKEKFRSWQKSSTIARHSHLGSTTSNTNYIHSITILTSHHS
jgi:hypothetical protein